MRLHVTAGDGGTRSSVKLEARTSQDGSVLGQFLRNDLTPDELRGNLALLSHMDGTGNTGPSAMFDDWLMDGPGISGTTSATFGPIMFAQYTLHRGLCASNVVSAPPCS